MNSNFANNQNEKNSFLNRFAINLNEAAKNGKLDPVIGRDEEIRRILQILSRRTKNNPILIGEAGVGKTAIVEALAGMIHRGEVPSALQNKRISTRTVQELVKKYARIISPLKKITPHKLRSTFGTNLYKQTGDIYVVADCLGHKDVNTTKKHYAAITEDIKKNAGMNLKLTNRQTD